MIFRHRVPRPPLDACVESIWFFQDAPRAHAFERLLPTGAAGLIVNLAEDQVRSYDPDRGMRCETTVGTVFCGVQSRHTVIDTAEQEHVLGVVFKPGGSVPFVAMPAFEARDRDVPLDVLWKPGRVAALRDELLHTPDPDAKLDAMERELRSALRPARTHPAVAFALQRFNERPRVASIAPVTAAVGLSAKRFIERFKADVGVTPKRYCRIRRFQQAVTRAHAGRGVEWTRVALDCGYCDQAHFINDFRAFAGLTPGAYLAARTDFQNHVKFLQSDAAPR